MENPNTPLYENTPAIPPRAAIVIIFQSQATVLVALGMLVLGTLIGFIVGARLPAALQALAPPPATVAAETSLSSLAITPTLPTYPASAATSTLNASSINNPTAVGVPNATATPNPNAAVVDTILARARHFKGDPNAPITIIEFGDFQCPFCGRFATLTEPQINEQYINPGTVRFTYLHFAFLGDESFWATEASECAAEQDAFWPYHDKVFANQSGENQGAFSKDNLKRFAVELGLDSDAFNTCLDSGMYTDLVREDSAFAQSLGVRSTPSFLINGEPLIGAQPIEAFQEVIQRVLIVTETE